MKELCKQHSRLPFTFTKINREEILREFLNLETSKACQDADIVTKVIKENVDIFADVLLSSFNDSVEKCNFTSSLKIANVAAAFKKR